MLPQKFRVKRDERCASLLQTVLGVVNQFCLERHTGFVEAEPGQSLPQMGQQVVRV